jgi:hypothetical protein
MAGYRSILLLSALLLLLLLTLTPITATTSSHLVLKWSNATQSD